MMAEAVERNNLQRFIDVHGLDCIQCGTCNYACPAKRPPDRLRRSSPRRRGKAAPPP
jgi:electron transport complex protein RnfC